MYLNRAHVEVRQSHQERKEDIGGPIKLDAEAQAHIEKHRCAIFCFEFFLSQAQALHCLFIDWFH